MKYKSFWLLFLLFIALAGFTYYMFKNKTSDKISMLMADRDFAIKDIDKIQKIFLADRNKPSVTLEKINGVWMLNGRHKAALNPIKNLLETIKDVRMQSIPSKGHVKSIMEGLAIYGIKVEIYGIKNELLKTYYVGGSTQSEYGTYFFMEHGSQPYIMGIPYFVGDVRARFDLDSIDWRDHTVFDVDLESIEKLSLEYPYKNEQSFVIKKNGNQFELFDFATPELKINNANPTALKSYLQSYNGIGAQDIQNTNPMRKEAANSKPYCMISIYQSGQQEPMTYKIFPMETESTGKVRFAFDQKKLDNGDYFRMHIDRSDGDFLLMQYPNVAPVLKKKLDFK